MDHTPEAKTAHTNRCDGFLFLSHDVNGVHIDHA